MLVSCAFYQLADPPMIGSVITVKHSGFNQNGTLKQPYFWKEKDTVVWQNTSSDTELLLVQKLIF